MTSFKPIRFFALLFILTFPLGANAVPDCANASISGFADFWIDAGPSDVTRCLSAGLDLGDGEQVYNILTWIEPEALRALFDAGLDPQFQPYGLSLLSTMLNSRYNLSGEIVKVFLNAGMTLDDEELYQLFYKQDRGNYLEITKILVDAGADINKRKFYPRKDKGLMPPPLAEAVKLADVETVKFLIDAGADVNVISLWWGSEWGLLHFIRDDDREAAEKVKVLLDAGVDPNAGESALGYVRSWDPIFVVQDGEYSWDASIRDAAIRLLLDAGAREEKRPDSADSVDIVLPDPVPDPVDDCEARRARGENKTCGIR